MDPPPLGCRGGLLQVLCPPWHGGALLSQMTLPVVMPTSLTPTLQIGTTQALRGLPAVEPLPPCMGGKATSETRGPFTRLPGHGPWSVTPDRPFLAGLSPPHTQPWLWLHRMPIACFFLVPGRPIRWALKIALGLTGRPGQRL